MSRKSTKTSIVTALKNRSQNLLKAIPSWLDLDIDEIIIVDWSSDTPIGSELSKFKDKRIKVYEVQNQPTWCLALAFNIGVELASGDHILKLDADIQIEKDFLQNHELMQGMFFAGNWRNARNPNEIPLNGVLYITKNDFKAINGYNEYFKLYGWDDSDLYQRLIEFGVERKDIHNNYVYHLPHDERVANQDSGIELIDDSKLAKIGITVNRKISELLPAWSSSNSGMTYDIIKKSKNYFVLISNKEDINNLDKKALDKIKKDAVIEHLEREGFSIKEDAHEFDFSELLSFYNVVNYSFYNKKNQGYKLYISLDFTDDISIFMKIMKMIYQNYILDFIKEVVVFGRNYDLGYKISTASLFKKIGIKFIQNDLSPKSIFEYIEQNSDGKFILSRSGVILDEELGVILENSLEDSAIVLTSYYKEEFTGNLVLPHFNDGFPDYFSLDTFVFNSSLKHFYSNIKESILENFVTAKLLNELYYHGDHFISNPCLSIKNISVNRIPLVSENYLDAEKDFSWHTGVKWNSTQILNTRIEQYFFKNNGDIIYRHEDYSKSNLESLVNFCNKYKVNLWTSDFTLEDRNGMIGDYPNVNFVDLNSIFHKNKSQIKKVGFNELEEVILEKNIPIEIEFDKTKSEKSKIKKSTNHRDSNPLISIITPSYNAVEYIERAIESVLEQDYQNFEHIIVDAGSDDGTLEVLKKYEHLKWISESDKGQSDAMNKGFAMSSGDIISYLNADDYYLPGCFKHVSMLLSDDVNFVIGKCKVVSEDGSYWINSPSFSYTDIIQHWNPQAFPVNPVSYFYSRNIQKAVGEFKISNHYNMDLEFLVKAFSIANILKVDSIFGVFENVQGTKTASNVFQKDHWTKNTYNFIDDQLKLIPKNLSNIISTEREAIYLERTKNNELLSVISTPNDLALLPDWFVYEYIKSSLKHIYGQKEIFNHITCNLNSDQVIGVTYIDSNINYYLKSTLEFYLEFQKVDHLIILTSNNCVERLLSEFTESDHIYESKLSIITSHLNPSIFSRSVIAYIINKILINKWVVNFEFGTFIDPILITLKQLACLSENPLKNRFKYCSGKYVEIYKRGAPSLLDQCLNYSSLIKKYHYYIEDVSKSSNGFEPLNLTTNERRDGLIFFYNYINERAFNHLLELNSDIALNQLNVFYCNQVKLSVELDNDPMKFKGLKNYSEEWFDLYEENNINAIATNENYKLKSLENPTSYKDFNIKLEINDIEPIINQLEGTSKITYEHIEANQLSELYNSTKKIKSEIGQIQISASNNQTKFTNQFNSLKEEVIYLREFLKRDSLETINSDTENNKEETTENIPEQQSSDNKPKGILSHLFSKTNK
jgi:glycosyltransferase involved in cell wall biosynthesis